MTDRDTFGRCVVCGRRDSHCSNCHLAHDYQWEIYGAGGGWVATTTGSTKNQVINRGDPRIHPIVGEVKEEPSPLMAEEGS